MSEAIDRAVAALKRLPVRDRENPGSELDELHLREAVRAVIQSLRDPTGAMRAVACDAYANGDTNVEVSEEQVIAAYQAMIDAALT